MLAAALVVLVVDAVAGRAPADGGDGRSVPYRRISDALDAVRSGALAGATIEVRPGIYAAETLPIRLDVPVRLVGSTVLLRDARRLPTGAVDATRALVQAAPALGPGSAILRVESDDVTVRGLVIDGGRASQGFVTYGIFVDGSRAPGGAIHRFAVEDNWVARTGIGVLVRLASGAVSGNLLGVGTPAGDRSYSPSGNQFGAAIGGGRADEPAVVTFARNRACGNGAFGATFFGDPARMSFPRLAENLAGALEARIEDNEFCANATLGFALALRENHFALSDVDQPATLTAVVSRNAASGNPYGLAVHAPQAMYYPGTALCPRVPARVSARLDGNRLAGNIRGAALVTFRALVGTSWSVAGCFVRDALIELDGSGDGLDPDYDAPECEPGPGTCEPLGNVLRLGGRELRGRRLGADAKVVP